MVPPRLDQEPRKNISMCLSVEPSEYQEMLHDVTGADAIYSKDYEGGTLYLLYHPSPQKMHSTLDLLMCDLEKTLKTAENPAEKFRKISDFKSGKIKTLKRNLQIHDKHYIAIFGCVAWAITKKPKIRAGVKIWTCEKIGRACFKRPPTRVSAKTKQRIAERVLERKKHVSSKKQALAKKKVNKTFERAQVKLTGAEEGYREALAKAGKAQAKLDKATAATAAALMKLRKAEDNFDTSLSNRSAGCAD